MHLLITLKVNVMYDCFYPGYLFKDGDKLDTSDKIDEHIWAKIPPKPEDDDDEDTRERKQRLRDNVINHMIHSACISKYFYSLF